MAKVCILTSAHQEMDPFFAELANIQEFQLKGISYKTAEFAGHELILCVSGVGMVNTAMSAGLLISECNPDYLMFCGVAGGTSKELGIADVVICSEAISPEYITTQSEFDGTPFEHCLTHPANNSVMPAWLMSGSIPEMDFSHYSFQVIEGRVTSSDQFPAPQKEYPALLKASLKAIDMETASLYQTGWAMNIPCFTVRAISNCLLDDGTDPDMNSANVAEAPQNAVKVSLDLIRKLA